MITLEESIPTKNDTYLAGVDIFYSQFNDISFYIEDEDQENFFYCILRKLFPNIKIEKIFPLNGKDNVILESMNNLNDKKKVFIVDKDFDDILNIVINNNNIFYLEKYSIENFLLEKEAFIEYIISEKPKLRKAELVNSFKFTEYITNITYSINHLIYLHILVKSKCQHLRNVSLKHHRFVNFESGSFSINNEQISNYQDDIETALHEIDRRYTLNAQMRKIKQTVRLNTKELCIKHMPGKYLIKMLKQIIESVYGLVSRNNDSFCYRIAEKCNFESLHGFKVSVENYITT